MKKPKLAFPFFIVVLILLTVCGCSEKEQIVRHEENPAQLESMVMEYYESLGITDDVRKNAKAVYHVCKIGVHKGIEKDMTLRLPEYFEKLYVIKSDENITFYEKYNYELYPENWEQGLLWDISIYTKEEFKEIENVYSNPYAEIIGANSVVIGSDEKHVYMLSLPTDVRFESEDTNATAYYKAAMNNREQIIADFLAVNHIAENELAPSIN